MIVGLSYGRFSVGGEVRGYIFQRSWEIDGRSIREKGVRDE